MPYLNGFEGFIRVKDGETLPCYGVVVDEAQRTLTCWISSEAGQQYGVNWRCRKHLMDSRGDVFLDGVGVGSERIHRAFRVKNDGGEFSSVEKTHATLGESRAFFFSELPTASDGSQLESESISANRYLGEIRLVINRIGAAGQEIKLNNGKREKRPKSIAILQERIERIATFIFKYRSLEVLDANGLLSREAIILPALPTETGDLLPEVPGPPSALDTELQAKVVCDPTSSTSQDIGEGRKRNRGQDMTQSDDELESEIHELQVSHENSNSRLLTQFAVDALEQAPCYEVKQGTIEMH
ncbi:hypothetical protein BDZ97DRAFT_805252 [Flammula alnicola]|nr:hypothetical protein BDZ97DRAFT_805252 [Flammula alnicola]